MTVAERQRAEQPSHLPAEINGKKNPLLRERYPDNWIHVAGRAVLSVYMRLYHNLKVKTLENMPQGAMYYPNHDSNLTTVALMVADPYYPQTIVPIKSEFFKIPIAKQVLTAWGAIPVDRDGHDAAAFLKLMRYLKQGRNICVAGEGTRSPDGVLQPLDSSFVDMVFSCARFGYPVHPIGIRGTYEALPKGSFIPKRVPIEVEIGSGLGLSSWAKERRLTSEGQIALAQYAQDELAALLPAWQRPKPGSPPMWTKSEYMKPKESLK